MRILNRAKMFLRLCIRGLIYGKIKTLLLMVTCAVAVAISMSLLGLIYDIRSQMQKELKSFGPNFVIYPQVFYQEEGISQGIFEKLKNEIPLNQETVLSPRLSGIAKIRGESWVVTGVEFDVQRRIAGHWELKGAWAKASGEVMVGERAAQRLGFRSGDHLKFDDLEDGFLVTGVFHAGGTEDEQFLLTLMDAQKVMGVHFPISSIQARLNGSLKDLEVLAEKIKTVHPFLEASPIRKVALSEGQVLDRIRNMIWIVNGLIFVITGLTIVSTSTALVSQRSEEFGLARALGATQGDLAVLFYSQAILSGLAGSPLGFILGYWGLDHLAQKLFSTRAVFRFELIPVIVLAVVATILLGGIIAVKRIAKIDPAVVLKGE